MPNVTHRGWTITACGPQDQAIALVDRILDCSLDHQLHYKNSRVSRVVRFAHGDRDFVLKVPLARNRRIREWLLRPLRGSPAARALRDQQELIRMGFRAPTGVLVAERRRFGVAVESFFVYEHVDGDPVAKSFLPQVASELLRLHALGYTRSDPKLDNFLIANGTVVFIDVNLHRPWLFPQLCILMELVRFVRSAPAAVAHLPPGLVASSEFGLATMACSARSLLLRPGKTIRRWWVRRRKVVFGGQHTVAIVGIFDDLPYLLRLLF